MFLAMAAGPARRDHQAGRPAAQHAHAVGAAQRRSSGASRKETMEIYAPLAARLGIWEMKWQLEDLAFRYLEPEQYKRVAEMLEVEARRPRAVRRARSCQIAQGRAGEARHRGRGVRPREAHLLASAKKIEKYAADGRTWTRSTTCWRCACSSRRWRTATPRWAWCTRCGGRSRGTFDDYIANPKESMYQSLHTTVMAPNDAAAGGADPHARDAPRGGVR